MARARKTPRPRAGALARQRTQAAAPPKQPGKPGAPRRPAGKPAAPSKQPPRPVSTSVRAKAKAATRKTPETASKPGRQRASAPLNTAARKAPAASRRRASSASPRRQATRKPELRGGTAVVKVLESRQPVAALRKFLGRITGAATMEQGQIALGSAQLMLLPIAREHRGGDEVKQLLDLVLSRWDAFPERAGFHAQEFLRNAFAAVGDDRERIARLSALVPADATSELRFNIACAHAISGDQPAMLRALEAALAAGVTAAQVRREPDFAAVLGDPAVIALLDRVAVPAIPVDVAPHIAPVRAALDALVTTAHELGEPSRLNPPATLEAVLGAERTTKIQLPNDYRALLTITDGMAIGDHEFFGTADYRGETRLASHAREFLEMSASYGGIGMDECVPLASWGQTNNWLLYDPRGAVREGDPGYVVMLTADPWPMADLADALAKLEDQIRDVLGTN